MDEFQSTAWPPEPFKSAVHDAFKAALLLAASACLYSVNASDESHPTALETVTVEAQKYPQEQGEIAGTVTVIDDARIKAELARSMEQLVRYEPGIEVPNQGSRFGSSGFVIRGIGGNRVRTEIDGVPISDAFAIGDFSNAGRDFIDVDSLRQVEIIRGPASALFGSNAVGGVVSLITLDPGDYLAGESRYNAARAGYYSSDSGWVGGATTAWQGKDWASLVGATWRQGEERQDVGADAHEYDSLNVLAKLTRGDVRNGGLRFTVEHFGADSDTDVISQQGTRDFSGSFGYPYVIDIFDVKAHDTRARTRLSVSQAFVSGWRRVDYLRWRLYYQDSETRQLTDESRETQVRDRLTTVRREREFRFDQNLLGAELNAASYLDWGSFNHELSYGLELEWAETSEIRDGVQVDLDTGEVSSVLGPDSFPVRDFPVSDTGSVGIYLQDRIESGSWTVIPGLRWDRYSLDPKPDEIFRQDNPGIEPVDLDESKLLPRLGVLWQISDDWQAYAQYSEGFRAPPVNDVNIGFTNFRFGYTALPNPELQSETSRGLEGGLRLNTASLRIDFAAFRTKYDDFIQSRQVVGVDPDSGLVIFQSINVDRVRIDGIEASVAWTPDFVPDGLSLRLAAALTEGDNLQTGEPLNAVAPLSAVAGVEYSHPGGRWGGSLLARGAAEQDRLDESQGPLYVPGGYVVLDATAWYRPGPASRIRAGLFNLTDKDYTRWLDVAGLPASTPNTERFRRPGFNVGLVFDFEF